MRPDLFVCGQTPPGGSDCNAQRSMEWGLTDGERTVVVIGDYALLWHVGGKRGCAS